MAIFSTVGKGPDVIVGAHDWLGELVQNQAVKPINLSADMQAKFPAEAMAATKFNGQIYGVPYAVENIGIVRLYGAEPAMATKSTKSPRSNPSVKE